MSATVEMTSTSSCSDCSSISSDRATTSESFSSQDEEFEPQLTAVSDFKNAGSFETFNSFGSSLQDTHKTNTNDCNITKVSIESTESQNDSEILVKRVHTPIYCTLKRYNKGFAPKSSRTELLFLLLFALNVFFVLKSMQLTWVVNKLEIEKLEKTASCKSATKDSLQKSKHFPVGVYFGFLNSYRFGFSAK